jgi:hypothetical protein
MVVRGLFLSLLLPLSLAANHGIALSQSTPDTGGPSWVFLPGRILSLPFAANPQEPRVGLRKEVGSSKMKLDIGSTVDLLEFRITGQKHIRFGIDFFTYALTTSSQGLRLQIDAVDGFFGGHIVFTDLDGDNGPTLRLRIMHLSAHFIDGHYDMGTQQWKDGRGPIPFTKDFGELVGAYSWQLRDVVLLAYTGFSYATLVRPTEIERISTMHGVQAYSASLAGPAFGRPLNIYIADNLTLVGIPRYIGTNNLEIGLKFGEWSGTGIRLYGSYFSGLNVFSQYYNVHTDFWGIGFAFDFW